MAMVMMMVMMMTMTAGQRVHRRLRGACAAHSGTQHAGAHLPLTLGCCCALGSLPQRTEPWQLPSFLLPPSPAPDVLVPLPTELPLARSLPGSPPVASGACVSGFPSRVPHAPWSVTMSRYPQQTPQQRTRLT
eukprot:3143137-Rhodomonas_salina.5